MGQETDAAADGCCDGELGLGCGNVTNVGTMARVCVEKVSGENLGFHGFPIMGRGGAASVGWTEVRKV